MKAEGEIEALKTLTDFRKQAFSNAPRAGLRLGPPTALSCLPVVQQKVGKELIPTHEGKHFGRTWMLLPSGGRETETTPCPWWSPAGCPGDRSWDHPRVPHAPDTILSPPRVRKTPRHIRSRVSSSLCKQENLQLVTDGGVRLVSLGFAVKLFKTNLDVATLFLQ